MIVFVMRLAGCRVQLKSHYEELLSAHKALRAQHLSLREERDQVETQYQQLCEGWRIELEDKQAAFDEARRQLLNPKYAFISLARCLSTRLASFLISCA